MTSSMASARRTVCAQVRISVMGSLLDDHFSRSLVFAQSLKTGLPDLAGSRPCLECHLTHQGRFHEMDTGLLLRALYLDSRLLSLQRFQLLHKRGKVATIKAGAGRADVM